MELIASLERSHPTEGLTERNFNHLQKVYKDAVGDKKEIDLNDFKKIVQSKNMFFVERIFNIFDVDNSGTVSLEEFIRVMSGFSKQTPLEKLRYLFQVYDLNGDGTIQFSELRNVISECMKENGLAFSNSEIDELTSMLFEDADTDGSGSITFNEFQDQLQRNPAFMENLTLSVERCLLPPKDPPQVQFLSRWKPRKLNWKHIRNNWASVMFLMFFLLINVALFAARVVEYHDSNIFVQLARGCGQCLNFNCAFILVLVLRQSLTWLRTHGLAEYLPIDQHLYYHKMTGCFILGYSVLHTVMHIANFDLISLEKEKPLHLLLFSTAANIGWVNGSACLTGWLLLFILIVMLTSAMSFVRRNGKFEVFYCLHQLSLVFWICLILHGPNFWKWFLAPAVLYLVEAAIRINRNLSSSKKAYVQQGILLPSHVTQLVIKRPRKFDYRPGDYLYINIPEIAKFEWHPFTISSAPELDDVIWLHIRGVGEWTNSLYRFFAKQDREAVLSEELARDFETHSVKNLASIVSGLAYESPPRSPKKGSPESKQLVVRSTSESSAYTNPLHDTFNVISPAYGVQRCIPSAHIAVDMPQIDNSFDSCNQSRTSQIFNKTMDDSSDVTPNRMSLDVQERWSSQRRTSFCSTSTSRVIQKKNKEDAKSILTVSGIQEIAMDRLHPARKDKSFSKDKRKSVRVSVADRGLRRCQTVIVMPTVNEDDEDEASNSFSSDLPHTEEEVKDLHREVEIENVVVNPKPLKIFLDGPYGSPTRHIFQARHAVLIATGIGVTPFASILQSIMHQYRKSRHTCPKCNHRWSDPRPVSSVQLRKVDFFWLNRHQRSFEWFVSLLSELEIEQAQLQENERFLDIHMYITSALDRTDMKAVGLQMALDLLYQKEKRCLITGLKSRTQPGRPDWSKVFQEIARQKKGKVTVFFCGPSQLAKTLLAKCNEFGFRFRKEIF